MLRWSGSGRRMTLRHSGRTCCPRHVIEQWRNLRLLRSLKLLMLEVFEREIVVMLITERILGVMISVDGIDHWSEKEFKRLEDRLFALGRGRTGESRNCVVRQASLAFPLSKGHILVLDNLHLV
jgi:hypothetical protein